MARKRLFGAWIALAMMTVVLAVDPAATLAIEPATRVVSLGDSYTAGNGAEGTSQAGAANSYFGGSCSQHPDAYPFRVTRRFPNATLDHLACSGATTNDVLVDQLSQIVDPANVDFYFITIGGNDFGFESVVATCLVLGLSNLCSQDLDGAEAQLPTVLTDTEAILDDLTAQSPNAEIVLVGYPLLASPLCPTGTPNQDRLTDLQMLLDSSQAALADSRENLSFVSVQDTFAGQGPCLESTTPPTTRGAGLVHHLYLFDTHAESFHPNQDGHVEIAEEVLELDFSTTPSCNGLEVTVDIAAGEKPTSGDDVILGTANADVIVAGDGDDTICGLGGDDTLNGGAGNDHIRGGGGNDTVFGLDGNDTIFGGVGDDEIIGSNGIDTINGGDGNDTINGGDGNDTIFGGDGDDDIFGQEGNDTLNGEAGDDFIIGVDGVDTISGGAGADTINGGPDKDSINGNGDDDIIFGLSGDDTLNGGAGNDEVFGQLGVDSVDGGTGDDRIFGNEGNDTLSASSGINVFNGGPGNDTITGGTGPDEIFGDGDLLQAGDDILDGGAGEDLLIGFAGNDTINAADGEQDTVNGGPHTTGDTCTVDTGAVADTVFNCEP